MEQMIGQISRHRSAPSPEPDLAPELRMIWRGAPSDLHRWIDVIRLLRGAGLRPTRQRLVLGRLLFSKGNRHVTAAMLHDETMKARIPMSLATVYNTLHHFTEVGLLRRIGVSGTIAFFDTNPSRHHHFFVEDEHMLFDIPAEDVGIDTLPATPTGFDVSGVDVVVRLKRRPC